MTATAKQATFFLGVGAARAGMTWLWSFLQAHPDVAPSPIPALQYFAGRYLEGFRRSVELQAREALVQTLEGWDPRASGQDGMRVQLLADWLTLDDDDDYLAYFAELRALSGRHTFGEVCSDYARLPEPAWTHVQRLFPDARFLFLMRNPTDRAWSAARARAGKANTGPEGLFRLACDATSHSETDYTSTLQRLVRATGRERVFTAFIEELSAPGERGAEQRAELLSFLDLEKHDQLLSNEQPAVPRAQTIPLALRWQLVSRYRSVYEFAEGFLGHLPEAWREDLRAHDAELDRELRGEWA